MNHVLAAIDDSPAAGPVLTAAAALAPLLGSTVEAVHVGDPEGTTAQECASRAGVPFRHVAGDPADRLIELAAEDVTAVVVGARDRWSHGGTVGHLTLQLADRLPRPLLVVPPDCSPSARIGRVVVALEGSPHRAKPLRHALAVVSGGDLDLTVVHVDSEESVPAFSDSAAHESAEFAQEYLTRYWPLAPKARLALPVGQPATEILLIADEIRPDILVAGWPQGAGPEHGHVVRELLERSAYPVLLVAVSLAANGSRAEPLLPG